MTVIDMEMDERKYENEIIIKILKSEILVMQEKIKKMNYEDTGHFFTTIRTLEERIKELS